MKTLLVPTFDYEYTFMGYVEVKVKNKMDNEDYNKVISMLPGYAQGYCPALYTITETKEPLSISNFYDIRQKGAKKLKNYFISVKE